MFVDDDELVLKAIDRLFQFQPYEVVTFLSAKEALSYLVENPVQVLVSDLRMPEMDGLDLLRQAQETRPETVRVVLSAYSDRESLLDAINSGNIYRYILKPWDAVELISVVRQSADMYSLRLENQRLAEALRSISVRDVVGGSDGANPEGVTLLHRYGAYVASELSRPVEDFSRVAELGSRVSGERSLRRSELLEYMETVGQAADELEAIRRDLVDDKLLVGLARELELDLNTAIQRVVSELNERRQGLPYEIREELASGLPGVTASPILLSRLLSQYLSFVLDHSSAAGEPPASSLRVETRGRDGRAELHVHCPGSFDARLWEEWEPLLQKLARSIGGALRKESAEAGKVILVVDFPAPSPRAGGSGGAGGRAGE